MDNATMKAVNIFFTIRLLMITAVQHEKPLAGAMNADGSRRTLDSTRSWSALPRYYY
jgi:hypothetical protein